MSDIPVVTPFTIPPLVPPFSGVPMVTPFTYRDNLTYLQRLERLCIYVNKTLAPWVETTVNTLGSSWVTTVQEITSVVEDAVNSIGDQVQDAEAAQAGAEAAQVAAEAAQAAAEAAATSAATANDTAITALFNNLSSAFRIALDDEYADKSDFEAHLAAFSTLVADVATKAEQDDLDLTNTALASLSETVGTKASQSALNAVEASLQDQIDDNAAEVLPTIRAVRFGASHDVSPFEFIRAGVLNPNQDTRVVILGSSTTTGSKTAEDQYLGGFQKAAARAGSPTPLPDLLTVVSPPAANGMVWWNGAAGGLTSGNYFTTARRTAIDHVSPHFVTHMIGENDISAQTSLTTYKNNVRAACLAIETDTPGVKNVLIHGPGRIDIVALPLKWADYRNALKEVADENPNRIFIDLMEGYAGLGTDNSTNHAGLVVDGIHNGAVGHQFIADMLCEYMGIPSTTNFAPNTEFRRFTFPAGATYNADTDIATDEIDAAFYPRVVKLQGVMYVTPTNGNAEIYTRAMDGATVIDGMAIRIGQTGTHTVPISTAMFIPPNQRCDIVIRIGVGGGTVTMLSPNIFTRVYMTIEPL